MTPTLRLARAWRFLGDLGYVDTIFNHISVCSGGSTFYMNKQETLAIRATEDAFIEASLDSWPHQAPAGVNPDGWQLHMSIHRERRRPGAAIHTHSRYATAVANTMEGLLPTSQAAMELIPEIVRVDYEGPFRDCVSSKDLLSLARRGGIAMLQSHGLLAVADSLEEATYLAYYMEEASRVQVVTLSQRLEPMLPSATATAKAAKAMANDRPELALQWFDVMTKQV